MDLPDRNQAVSWEGKRVVDRDGEPLGTCTGVFADTETGVTEWLDVDLEGQGRSFVPALEATADGDSVRVSFTRDAVLSAPTVGDHEQLSKRDETELYRHYGVPVASSGSVLPDEAAGSVPPAHDDAAPAGVLPSTSDDTTAGVFAADRDTPAVSAQDTDEPAGRLGGEDVVAGAAGPPETGHDLPVLDPVAASVPVPDDEVVYVDDREPFVQDGQDGQDDEPVAPRLSRVPEQPAAAPSPWPPPASQAGPGALSTGAPLAGVAALAAGVFVVLNALEERRRRRNSPAAKADRLRRQVGAGARTARAGAAHSLSVGGAAAATTGRRLSTAASAASADAAKKQRELLVAASTASSDLAQQRRRAARTASRRAQRRQRRIAAQLSAASARAGRTGAAATGAVAAVPAAVGSSLSGAATSVAGTTRTATRRKGRRKASVSAAPRKAAKKGRSVRRSLARKVWRLVLAGAAGGGYVLGAKAGRERYDEITDVTSAVASAPQVQDLTDAVTSRLGR